MKKFVFAFLVIAAIASAFVAGSKYSHDGSSTHARRVLYYVDPMHPAYKSDKPGTSPDCGMELVAVYADGASSQPSVLSTSSGVIAISPEQQQLIGVRVSTVGQSATGGPLRLYGRVTADENRVYLLNAGTEGVVREVSSVATGARVHKGDWLATVYSYESRVPIQSFLTTLDVLDAAKRRGAETNEMAPAEESSHFAEHRLQGVGMSAEQIEEMRRTRRSPVDIKITAPIDGFVLTRNTSVGQKFDKGVEWYRIANLDRVWIVADLAVDDANRVHAGTHAQVWLPNRYTAIDSVVSQVLPQADPTTRTLRVRLEAANPGFVLRPEMYVDVEMAGTASTGVFVPAEAVLDSGHSKTVFVERTQGAFEPREVKIGERVGDMVQVVSGLAAGERIVTSGNFLISSEAKLKGVSVPATAAHVSSARVTDPACGMEIDEAASQTAAHTATYKETTYHFCSEACKRKFTASPEKYLDQSGERQHVDKNDIARVNSIPVGHHDR